MKTIHHTKCLICGGEHLDPTLTCTDHLVSGQNFSLVQCEDCGFVLTQDAPDAASIGEFYKSEDYVAHSDTKQGMVNRLFHSIRDFMLSRKRRMIERSLGKTSGRLLDYGCGTGYFLNHMKTHGWTVEGIEPGKEAAAVARETFGLTVHQPEQLPGFEDETFDVITLWHVLEHVHDPKEALAQYRRILKPDGRLVIALPNFTSFDAKVYKAHWAAYDVPRHLWHFSPDTFEQFAGSSGFSLESIRCLPFDSFYVSMLSESNQHHKLAFLWGGIIGKLSWIRSWFGVKSCSSVVYFLLKD